jgi:VanZ family protein
MTSSAALLAWTPFLQPAPAVALWWWVLVLPLSLFISMAWKSVRVEQLQSYWPAVAKMSVQIIVGMIGLFVGLAILIRVIVPMIPGD